ncbi:alpha/beta hydrolase [Rubripirellula tenax]|uniref:alpha/beta hydrolase n=1 Tax=Rubripirellula tenax TaxID=2528015 RepID=UPI001FE683E2|nr:alpha/beta hydrolase-fold protein [Rubripirellula tenax]
MSVQAQPVAKQTKKPSPPFQWVNPPAGKIAGVTHHSFKSTSLKQPVGYCLYLPPSYRETGDAVEQKYPVVYYLHGGRPGSETKSIRLATYIDAAMRAGEVPEMVYVFVNGGPVSHYNMPDDPTAQGQGVFLNELIPHIEQTYRVIANRSGRGLEGFSQGGRGTSRIMFKHPELFCSAAPGGGGYSTEKNISENNGEENPKLIFAPGDNTWDLARAYAKNLQARFPLRIQFHVGTKGFNYENNLAFMSFLAEKGIPFEKVIVPDAGHSAMQIYETRGNQIMNFHAKSFGLDTDVAE